MRRSVEYTRGYSAGYAAGLRVRAIEAQKKRTPNRPRPGDYEPSYEDEVAYTVRVISERGCIWEGCRPAFEAGEYRCKNLARMLREGVIVPDDNPLGGYVLHTARPEWEGK